MPTTASTPDPQLELRCTEQECTRPLTDERVAFLHRSGFSTEMVRKYATCEQCAARLIEEARQQSLRPASPEDRADARRRASRLPGQFWEHRLADLQALTPMHATAILALNGWVQEGGGVFICGPVGVGKTTLAAAACAERLRTERCTWTSVPSLIAGLSADFDSERYRQALEALDGTGALCLDDLGQERPTEQARERLFTAIDTRVAEQAPLVITSNLLPSELGDRYGAWLPSRLQGYCTAVRLGGEDRRLHPPQPLEGEAA